MAYTNRNITNYYVIVNDKSGRMLLEDGKLPFYWNKGAAMERAKLFPGFVVKPIEAQKINELLS